MSAPLDGRAAASGDGARSPFTLVGDTAALCEGDVCALPASPAGHDEARSDALALATPRAT
ncbi:hypothetical protein ACNHYB_03950 [Isoptericola jiangsuensis]|uniref:hypothetical protein n=1 Tax=Isoptericola jiangsuensis TaxID=548579 RepID=UPI003AAEB76A